jgi:hypothetical protein
VIFFYILLPALLISIGIGIYVATDSRPQPFPEGIRGIIPYIATVDFETLEAEVVKQYSNQEADEVLHLSKIEQRCIQQRRFKWLAHQVDAMKSNIKLYRSAASWELAQVADKSLHDSDRLRLAALILHSSPRCLLALMVLGLQIKLVTTISHIRPYNQTLNRPFVLHFVARKYAHLTDYALTVAQSYGHVDYENLLSAL